MQGTMTKPNAFQVRISSGGFRSAFRAPGSPRLSPTEKDALATQMARAQQKALDGDDSELRSLTQERYAVECVSDIGAFDGNMRKRKFSNPLFLTPSGDSLAFPECDGDLFTTREGALICLEKRLPREGEWEVRQTSLALELQGKRYLRWVKEVKGQPYTEPRRTQEELAEIYLHGGLPALLKIYSKAHALKVAKRLISLRS